MQGNDWLQYPCAHVTSSFPYISLSRLISPEIASALQRQNLRSCSENQSKHQAIIQLTPDKPRVLEEFFSLAHLHNFWCLPILTEFRYSISWAHCSLCLVYAAYPGSLSFPVESYALHVFAETLRSTANSNRSDLPHQHHRFITLRLQCNGLLVEILFMYNPTNMRPYPCSCFAFFQLSHSFLFTTVMLFLISSLQILFIFVIFFWFVFCRLCVLLLQLSSHYPSPFPTHISVIIHTVITEMLFAGRQMHRDAGRSTAIIQCK